MEGIFVCKKQIDRINGIRKEKHVCRVGIGVKGKDRHDEIEKRDAKKSVKEKELTETEREKEDTDREIQRKMTERERNKKW